MNEIYMQDNICGYAPLDEKERDELARAAGKGRRHAARQAGAGVAICRAAKKAISFYKV